MSEAECGCCQVNRRPWSYSEATDLDESDCKFKEVLNMNTQLAIMLSDILSRFEIEVLKGDGFYEDDVPVVAAARELIELAKVVV